MITTAFHLTESGMPTIENARQAGKPVVLSQCNYILAHLRAGNTLTPAEAYERFGSLALHSRIAELRERGLKIECELVEVPSGKRVGRYKLVAA